MKYKVTLGYRKYIFDDAEEAMIFATQAKKHYVPDKDEESITVDIEIVLKKEGNDEQLV